MTGPNPSGLCMSAAALSSRLAGGVSGVANCFASWDCANEARREGSTGIKWVLEQAV